MAILHFQNAVTAHLQWSREFAAYLEGHSVSAEYAHAGRDDLCVIGKWLHGEGAGFSHFEPFGVVKTLHRELHELAGQAVQAKAASDRTLLNGLMGQMDQVRHDLFMAWSDLNEMIGALE